MKGFTNISNSSFSACPLSSEHNNYFDILNAISELYPVVSVVQAYYTGTFGNVNRSPEGNYVAVSSRGNFCLTWEPGQIGKILRSMLDHRHSGNRTTGLLLEEFRTLAGELMVAFGFLYMVADYTSARITDDFEEVQVQSRGFGILDIGYRSQDEARAGGGSGVLLKTTNSWKTWTHDKAADNIAANPYSIKFVNDKQGFVLENDGVLLKYLGRVMACIRQQE
ncbi:photosystem II stability/assembly factor HCF136, chloroplastic-like [Primulina tabacum]|uniref:photosystem II stability/assembly factor HCF136, chloroplastic-like n=1 Tax=Primulina tabacum TaxID=48773 RepID=UPI003F59092F